MNYETYLGVFYQEGLGYSRLLGRYHVTIAFWKTILQDGRHSVGSAEKEKVHVVELPELLPQLIKVRPLP